MPRLLTLRLPLPPRAGGLPGGVGEQALDLLPSAGLVTSSEDYYPTVAINALMRVLREPSMAALHGKAVAALFEIIKAMGLSFVPYLPKVGCAQAGAPPQGVTRPAANWTLPITAALSNQPLLACPSLRRWCRCCCS